MPDEDHLRWPDGTPVTLWLVISEEHDGFVGHVTGARGVVCAQADTYGDCVHELCSAAEHHVKTFGTQAIADEPEPRPKGTANARVIEARVINASGCIQFQNPYLALCGSIPREDVDEMMRAIEEDCERVCPEEWELDLDGPRGEGGRR